MSILGTLFISTVAVTAPVSQDVIIHEARYSESNLIDLVFSSDCHKDNYVLEISQCNNQMPRKCDLALRLNADSHHSCGDVQRYHKQFPVPESINSPGVFISFNQAKNPNQILASRQKTQTAIIKKTSLKPTANIQDSDISEYIIEATVMLGANPCQAKMITTDLLTEFKDDVLSVTAVKSFPEIKELEFCTFEYNPVFKTMSKTIRFQKSQISQIKVLNLSEMDRVHTVDLF